MGFNIPTYLYHINIENGESMQTKASYFESGWVAEEDLVKEKKRKEGSGFKFPWDK